MSSRSNNVFDCALVLEGGGYRGAYTAGIISRPARGGHLLRLRVRHLGGSSNTVNYVSRDQSASAWPSWTSRRAPPTVGSLDCAGKGYFNADYLYGRRRSRPVPFDWEAFERQPGPHAHPGLRARHRTHRHVHQRRHEAPLTRPERYNKALDRLEPWRRGPRAARVAGRDAHRATARSTATSSGRLCHGPRQGLRELPRCRNS